MKSTSQDQTFEPSTVRILLAEDNAVNQKVTRWQLRRLGFSEVDIAANGREVLEVLKRGHYDVILMDCQMPEMDGYEATRCIRQDYADSIRIIALTAKALDSDRERCLTAGMDDYLTKPVSLENLKSAIQRNYEGLFKDG